MARAATASLVLAALLAPAIRTQAGGAKDEAAPAYPYEIVPHDALRGHLMEGPFKEPLGVDFDPVGGELFVADSKNDLVGIFDAEGTPLFAFGGRARLLDPRVVRVTGNGNVYVLDSERDRIKAFNYRGEPQPALSFSYPATDDHPAGTASVGAFTIDKDGRWYVGDLTSPQVLVYDADLTFRFAIRPAKARARFEAITGIAVSGDGLIAVVDFKATPVQIFDSSGRFLRGFGTRDIGLDSFSAPLAARFDEEGFLYVVDMLRHDVKVFDNTGRFLSRFGGWFSPETGGRAPGEMLYPTDIAIAPGGFLYVSERFGQRVQLFLRRPLPEAGEPRLRIPAVGRR